MKSLLIALILGVAFPVLAGDHPDLHREYPIEGIPPTELGQALSAAQKHFEKDARVLSVNVEKGSIGVATVYLDGTGQEIGEAVFVSRTDSGWPLQKRISPIHVGGIVGLDHEILSKFLGQLPRDYQCLAVAHWKQEQIVVHTGSYRSASDCGGMTYVYEYVDGEWHIFLEQEWGP